ncbi:MAG: adenosine kinase [Pseudomonadota bacterium]
MTKSFQVVGIGNAIVDVLAQTDDSFLDHMGIEKGIMQLVDRPRAEMLYAAMSERVQAPGGSVANTLAGLGELGVRCAFIGRVKDDALGRFYAQGMEAEGTAFPNLPLPEVEAPTSRSMIFVTPDGERSMNTYLGAGADLGPEDVAEDVFSDVGLLFLEGYLFDKVPGKAAFEAAARYARASGGHAGITLSDPFCVDRHRADFQRLVADELNFVIGNQHEFEALYETDDLNQALAQASSVCELVVCTRSGDPVILLRGDARAEVPVRKVVPVDATGAGDQFAAGFLYGLVTGQDLKTCGRMGVVAAAEVISHFGARPKTDVRAKFVAEGLI